MVEEKGEEKIIDWKIGIRAKNGTTISKNRDYSINRERVPSDKEDRVGSKIRRIDRDRGRRIKIRIDKNGMRNIDLVLETNIVEDDSN